MVSRAVILVAGVFLLSTSARADLKLTPQIAEYDLDGFKMKHLVFSDGSRRVTYAPPAGWDYSGSANLFVLHPSHSRGEATIARIALPQKESFDDETTKRLIDEVIASAPKGADNVALVSQEKNPLMIERKETLLIMIKYDFHGEPFSRSVMFLNRQDDQLRFQLTAPRSNFPELQRAFQASHYSWQNL
jgi:hypothetical protein